MWVLVRRLAVRNAGACRTAIGYVILLLLSLFSSVVPYVHMKEKGVGVTSLGNTSGHLFFVWTLIAIGVIGLFSAILAARGLWSLPWSRGISKKSSSSA